MSTLTFFRQPTLGTNHWGRFFDNFVDDMFINSHNAVQDRTHPTTKVQETDEGYAISLVAPGLNREDFNISLENELLTIGFEATNKEERAINYSSFSKSWTVPEGTSEKDIGANYTSGILTLSLKKPKKQKSVTKKITVS